MNMGADDPELQLVTDWIERCIERPDVEETLTDTWWWWWSAKVVPWSTKVVLEPGEGIWGGR